MQELIGNESRCCLEPVGAAVRQHRARCRQVIGSHRVLQDRGRIGFFVEQVSGPEDTGSGGGVERVDLRDAAVAVDVITPDPQHIEPRPIRGDRDINLLGDLAREDGRQLRRRRRVQRPSIRRNVRRHRCAHEVGGRESDINRVVDLPNRTRAHRGDAWRGNDRVADLEHARRRPRPDIARVVCLDRPSPPHVITRRQGSVFVLDTCGRNELRSVDTHRGSGLRTGVPRVLSPERQLFSFYGATRKSLELQLDVILVQVQTRQVRADPGLEAADSASRRRESPASCRRVSQRQPRRLAGRERINDAQRGVLVDPHPARRAALRISGQSQRQLHRTISGIDVGVHRCLRCRFGSELHRLALVRTRRAGRPVSLRLLRTDHRWLVVPIRTRRDLVGAVQVQIVRPTANRASGRSHERCFRQVGTREVSYLELPEQPLLIASVVTDAVGVVGVRPLVIDRGW